MFGACKWRTCLDGDGALASATHALVAPYTLKSVSAVPSPNRDGALSWATRALSDPSPAAP